MRISFRKLFLLFLFISISSAFAQDINKTKVSGYAMGDYYWFAKSNNSQNKDQHGLWFRRIYLTFDNKLSNKFDVRIRFEMKQPGDLKTKSKMSANLKDIWLSWKTGGSKLYLGLTSTPTWGLVEKVWGYRSIARTMLDLQKFGSSRDIGIAVKGKIDGSGRFKYHAMYANGASNSSEINKGKKFLAAVSYYPVDNLMFELYGDYSDNAGESDNYTVQAFLGYNSEDFRAGLQYANQTQKYTAQNNLSIDMLSAFAASNFAEKWSAFVRADRLFQPNPGGNKISYLPFDNTAAFTLLILGVDFHPIKNVNIMPNVETVIYDKNDAGITPGADLIPRLSFFFKW